MELFTPIVTKGKRRNKMELRIIFFVGLILHNSFAAAEYKMTLSHALEGFQGAQLLLIQTTFSQDFQVDYPMQIFGVDRGKDMSMFLFVRPPQFHPLENIARTP